MNLDTLFLKSQLGNHKAIPSSHIKILFREISKKIERAAEFGLFSISLHSRHFPTNIRRSFERLPQDKKSMGLIISELQKAGYLPIMNVTFSNNNFVNFIKENDYKIYKNNRYNLSEAGLAQEQAEEASELGNPYLEQLDIVWEIKETDADLTCFTTENVGLLLREAQYKIDNQPDLRKKFRLAKNKTLQNLWEKYDYKLPSRQKSLYKRKDRTYKGILAEEAIFISHQVLAGKYQLDRNLKILTVRELTHLFSALTKSFFPFYLEDWCENHLVQKDEIIRCLLEEKEAAVLSELMVFDKSLSSDPNIDASYLKFKADYTKAFSIFFDEMTQVGPSCFVEKPSSMYKNGFPISFLLMSNDRIENSSLSRNKPHDKIVKDIEKNIDCTEKYWLEFESFGAMILNDCEASTLFYATTNQSVLEFKNYVLAEKDSTFKDKSETLLNDNIKEGILAFLFTHLSKEEIINNECYLFIKKKLLGDGNCPEWKIRLFNRYNYFYLDSNKLLRVAIRFECGFNADFSDFLNDSDYSKIENKELFLPKNSYDRNKLLETKLMDIINPQNGLVVGQAQYLPYISCQSSIVPALISTSARRASHFQEKKWCFFPIMQGVVDSKKIGKLFSSKKSKIGGGSGYYRVKPALLNAMIFENEVCFAIKRKFIEDPSHTIKDVLDATDDSPIIFQQTESIETYPSLNKRFTQETCTLMKFNGLNSKRNKYFRKLNLVKIKENSRYLDTLASSCDYTSYYKPKFINYEALKKIAATSSRFTGKASESVAFDLMKSFNQDYFSPMSLNVEGNFLTSWEDYKSNFSKIRNMKKEYFKNLFQDLIEEQLEERQKRLLINFEGKNRNFKNSLWAGMNFEFIFKVLPPDRSGNKPTGLLHSHELFLDLNNNSITASKPHFQLNFQRDIFGYSQYEMDKIHIPNLKHYQARRNKYHSDTLRMYFFKSFFNEKTREATALTKTHDELTLSLWTMLNEMHRDAQGEIFSDVQKLKDLVETDSELRKFIVNKENSLYKKNINFFDFLEITSSQKEELSSLFARNSHVIGVGANFNNIHYLLMKARNSLVWESCATQTNVYRRQYKKYKIYSPKIITQKQAELLKKVINFLY